MAGKFKIKPKGDDEKPSTGSKLRSKSADRPTGAQRRSTSMGSGLGKVVEASRKADEKRAASNRRWVTMDDGDTIRLRVLDIGEDFSDVYVHRVPFERQGGGEYHLDVPCLDQEEKGVPCPGCKDDIDRRYKFYANVIVRDAPVVDEDGKDTGKEADQVMVWSGGITVARRLNKLHSKIGLQNRDIEVEREGVKKNTKYEIDWADDENTPLSANDKKLAKNKFDLSRYVKIPEYDDFYKAPRDRDGDDEEGGSSSGRSSGRRASPWGSRRSQRSSQKDSDDSSTRSGRSGRSSASKRSSSSSSDSKTTVRRRRPRT